MRYLTIDPGFTRPLVDYPQASRRARPVRSRRCEFVDKVSVTEVPDELVLPRRHRARYPPSHQKRPIVRFEQEKSPGRGLLWANPPSIASVLPGLGSDPGRVTHADLGPGLESCAQVAAYRRDACGHSAGWPIRSPSTTRFGASLPIDGER